MSVKKRFMEKEEGQSLVEFALILPIMLLLIVAVIDFGWYFYAKANFNNASRESARMLAVDPDTSLAVTAAQNYLDDFGMAIVTVSIQDVGGGEREAVVTVEGSVSPLVGLIYNEPIDISSTARMRIEYEALGD
ncbi:MAG: hypothetical protein HGA54_01855 [Actinobacteria bacterium]|nr:hypothetical protein [Actinomycetota bacterium]